MAMNHFFTAIIILTLLMSCRDSKFSKNKVENQANEIVQILNENNIEVFKNWNFSYRGKGELWTKLQNDREAFHSYFFKNQDSLHMLVFKKFLNSSEFPCKFKIDTSLFDSNFYFTKFSNYNLKIIAENKLGKDTLIGQNLSVEEVFGENDPFSKINSLSTLKDKLKVFSIRSNYSSGEFIEFVLTPQDILTYIPDSSKINFKYKKVFLQKLSKGKYIKENWNLRHLDKPLENS